MIYLLFVALVGLMGLGSAYVLRPQPQSRLSLRRSAFRAALVIASMRLVFLWGVVYFWSGASDWRQIATYFSLIFDCLIEMWIVRAWRNDFAVWIPLVSVLIVATSFG